MQFFLLVSLFLNEEKKDGGEKVAVLIGNYKIITLIYFKNLLIIIFFEFQLLTPFQLHSAMNCQKSILVETKKILFPKPVNGILRNKQLRQINKLELEVIFSTHLVIITVANFSM